MPEHTAQGAWTSQRRQGGVKTYIHGGAAKAAWRVYFMSVHMEQWYLYCKKADFRRISEKFNISPMLARILRNRDVVSDEDIEMYLYGGPADMYDPFLLKGAREAVSMLLSAVENKKRILIIGDYDADGVCSSYILYHFLEEAGADVSVRLPDRVKDGYGMNEAMVLEAKKQGISLILTCDNGISAVSAAAKAKELGMDLIITDHHTPPEILPAADVIINPKQKGCPYPYKEICGAAAAWKLMQALSMRLKEEKGIDLSETIDYLLEFAAIATITDIVPLKGENRIIAKEGLKRLKNTRNPGLKALMEIKSVDMNKISSYHIGFIIGPAINSAGRLKKADIAFDLLNEKDPAAARKKAQILADLNEERKKLTEDQAKEAMAAAEEKMKTDKVLVLYLPEARESVAGIIAGRIKEQLNRPAIVITESEEGLKGSGRSIEGYNIIEEISKYPQLFAKFGGHAKACGFTLKCGPDELSRVLNENCTLKEGDLIKKVWIDMQLPFEYACESFAEELSLTEPFGMENERPLFAEKNITASFADIAGKNRNALRMSLKNEQGTTRSAIMFGKEEELSRIAGKLKEGQKCSILYYPEINEFRGRRSVQLKVEGIRF